MVKLVFNHTLMYDVQISLIISFYSSIILTSIFQTYILSTQIILFSYPVTILAHKPGLYRLQYKPSPGVYHGKSWFIVLFPISVSFLFNQYFVYGLLGFIKHVGQTKKRHNNVKEKSRVQQTTYKVIRIVWSKNCKH